MIGWCCEVFFTGLHSAIIERNVKATGTTYLYMLPIYGSTMFGFEKFREILVLASLPLAVRVLFYLILIYAVEYSSGWLLRKITGHCPWQYPKGKWVVDGLIRLDYLPFWFAAVWMIEPIIDWLSKVVC
jgi:uncharacterized membrane protein